MRATLGGRVDLAGVGEINPAVVGVAAGDSRIPGGIDSRRRVRQNHGAAVERVNWRAIEVRPKLDGASQGVGIVGLDREVIPRGRATGDQLGRRRVAMLKLGQLKLAANGL